jgi:hypothetical protein
MKNRESRTQIAVGVPGPIEQRFESRALLPKAIAELGPQSRAAFGVFKCFLNPPLGVLAPTGMIEAKIGQELVHSAHGKTPSLIQPSVPWIHQLHDPKDRVAIGLKEPLRQQNRFGAAVSLDFALVGVELHPPDFPLVEQARRRRLDSGPGCGGQGCWITRETPAQMEGRVAIADEEPALGGAVFQQLMGERPDDLGEDLVGDGLAAVELYGEPAEPGENERCTCGAVAGLRASGTLTALVTGRAMGTTISWA